MKLTQILPILCLSFVTFFSQAKDSSVADFAQVTIKTELASPIVLDDTPQQNYLKISLIGREQEHQTRVPINLAIVIDRSGSMSGDRIEKAREAAIMAINMLNENDLVSVIAYDNDAKVIIPATKVVNKQQLIKEINDKVKAGGMTALFAGLSRGINQVDKYLDKEKVNRIILLSDGEANIGPTSINELGELAKIAAKKGISVTTIGIGEGYNEALMAAIARYSDGNHAFVQNSADLETVFVHEFKDVMSVIAQEVTVTIKLQDGVKPLRLLGRDGELSKNVVKVKMNQLYANQEKYVLLELIPDTGKAMQQKNIASITVEYDDLINKKSINYDDIVSISYTNQPEVVKNAIIEDVLAESEIQKVTLQNEKALELYYQGDIGSAKQMMKDSADKLFQLESNLSSPAAASRALEQAEKNSIMADEIETEDTNIYLKKATKMQFDSKQNNIKQK